MLQSMGFQRVGHNRATEQQHDFDVDGVNLMIHEKVFVLSIGSPYIYNNNKE